MNRPVVCGGRVGMMHKMRAVGIMMVTMIIFVKMLIARTTKLLIIMIMILKKMVTMII